MTICLSNKLEVEKLISKGLHNDEEIKILIEWIPEVDTMINYDQNHPAHSMDLFTHTIEVMRKVDGEILKITALLHDIGKPHARIVTEEGYFRFWGHEEVSALIALDILKRLGYPEDEIQIIIKLIKLHDTPIEDSETAIMRKVEEHGFEFIKFLLIHQKADLLSHSKLYIEKKLPRFQNVVSLFYTLYKE